ncbi:MAG: LysR family transcriptional regulator [Betaproteobacteria bacterium]|nr:MAG: LysR family transcriptional regulator [Betaproteobacteria bacterium]TMH64931.1 MAG: LysR family transcriptional regulator [Betaproteobacteria bacterium]
MDKLKQIEAFVGAVDTGSLARAALVADVTPVMIGRRIDALEKRLGVRLLLRSTRRLALTEQGNVYLEYCRKLLADLEHADNLIFEGRHTAAGHLVVSAPAAFGRKHVAPHGPSFVAKNPAVEVSFNLNDQVVDLVRLGFDMGVRIGGAIDPTFVAVRLATNRRVVCATPPYLKHNGVPRTLDDLAGHNCLAFNIQGGQLGGWHFRIGDKPVTVRVSGNLDCNDGELLHRWTTQGLGLSWRSTWEIQGELKRGELVTVLDEFALPSYDIMAVYPQQRHVLAKVRFFIEHLKRTYSEPDYWLNAS